MSNQTKVRGGTIHNVGNGFVVSDNDGWLSGKYDSIESAKLALKLKSKDNWSYLEKLTKQINCIENRSIVAEDMK